jgi:hypothetical protein
VLAVTCNPVFVVRLDALSLGSPGVLLTWKASTRPYPTSAAYEGAIRGGVTAFGDLLQSMSDRSGSPVVNGFTFEYFDKLGELRALLADLDTSYLTGQDVTVLFGSDIDLQTEATALVPIYRGQLLDPSPRPRRSFSIAAESRLGTRKGPYDMDSAVNKVTAQRAVDDGFPAVPLESVGKRLPMLWGEKTDAGIVNQFGGLVEAGMVGAVNLGPLPGTDAVYLPAPTWGTPQKYQNGTPVALETALGSGHTYTYIFGARTINGTWSLSAPLTLTGMPAGDEFSKSSAAGHRGFGTGIRLFVEAYTDPAHVTAVTNAATGDLMGNLWVKDGTADSTAPYRHMDAAGEAFTVGYDDNGDDSHYKRTGPALPPYPLAQLSVEAGDLWCFLRHPGQINQLFLSNLGGGATPTPSGDAEGAQAAYAAITADDLGVSVDLGPSGTGYEATVNGHYYFGVLLSGAKGLAARDGSFPPRANLCGWPGDDGNIINQAALALQDVVVQSTGGPHGRGSEDGTRLPIASFASYPAVPIVQTSAFETVQNQTKAFLGTDLGYLCAIYFGPDDASTWRQHWQQAWVDWQFDRFENQHGQDAIAVMDDTLPPTSGTLLREKIELAAGRILDAGAVQSNEIQNLERYQTGYAPIEGTYRSGVLEVRDEISVGRYGERTPGGDEAITSHKYTDDPPTARDAVSRLIADRAIGPSYIELEAKLKRLIPIPLGAQFRVEHSDLIQPGPIAVYLRDRTISPRRGMLRLRGRTRTRATFVSVVAPSDAVPYDEASPEAQATVFYISDDAGLLPDGTPGSRLR